MSISFTRSIVNRLNKEIADIQKQSSNEKQKKEKALSKINQLQRDIQISSSPSDLSNKMTRINKLKEEINQIDRLQANLAKQLANKNATLNQHLSKNQPE